MKTIALVLGAMLVASGAYAAEPPIIVDGCAVVETITRVDRVANGDEHHSQTVICYGDTSAPSVRKSSGISNSLMLTPGSSTLSVPCISSDGTIRTCP